MDNPVVVLSNDQQHDIGDYAALVDLFVIIVGATKQAGRLVNLADKLCVAGVRHLEIWNAETDAWVSVLYNYKKFIRSVPPCD